MLRCVENVLGMGAGLVAYVSIGAVTQWWRRRHWRRLSAPARAGLRAGVGEPI